MRRFPIEPGYNYGLSQDDPLFRGCVFATSVGGGSFRYEPDLIRGCRPNSSSLIHAWPGRAGPVRRRSDANSPVIFNGFRPVHNLGTGDFTAAVYIDPLQDISSAMLLFSNGADGTINNFWGLYQNRNASGASAGAVALLTNDGTTGILASGANSVLTAGVYQWIIGIRRANKLEVWKNNQLQVQGSQTSSSNLNKNVAPVIGYNGTGLSGRGHYKHTLLWNRALNPTEITELVTRRENLDAFGGRNRVYVSKPAAAAVTHPTTGALASDSAAISGTAAHSALHATSGALASQSATVAGTSAHLTLHATSGALSSASATVSGTAVHPHVTSGALAAQSAIIVGVAERSTVGTHTTTGALSSGAAVIAGTAAHIAIHATSGALSAQSAVIAGTSVHTAAGTGTGATVEEIWAYEIEPGVTAKMALQRILAVLGGKVSGAGTGTETFRDINDTRDALISVNDSNGNRSSLTWNDGP